jgi:hypothetical protein
MSKWQSCHGSESGAISWQQWRMAAISACWRIKRNLGENISALQRSHQHLWRRWVWR